MIDSILLRSGKGQIVVVPMKTDNYGYLLVWEQDAAVIDPSEEAPMEKILKQEGWQLQFLLVTHHHRDHLGGVEELKRKTGALFLAPPDPRIKNIDRPVESESPFPIGPFSCVPLMTPGHTKFHTVYYFPEEGVLFSGDLLFAGGCGRIFDGTGEEMLESMQKISSLPDDTSIYFGHEYTEKNLAFAARVDPKNVAIGKRWKKVEQLRKQGKSTSPSTLKDEKETNPFLRLDSLELQKGIGMEGESLLNVFLALRERKDQF